MQTGKTLTLTLDIKLETRISEEYRSRMAINIGYKQFPEFDIRKDQETVYARFVKYAERFKNNHLKAYNITGNAQQRSLFLDSKLLWTYLNN